MLSPSSGDTAGRRLVDAEVSWNLGEGARETRPHPFNVPAHDKLDLTSFRDLDPFPQVRNMCNHILPITLCITLQPANEIERKSGTDHGSDRAESHRETVVCPLFPFSRLLRIGQL